MKYCYECGGKIDKKDKRCPECGIKLRRVDEKMKPGTKVIIILLSLIVLPVIFTCASVLSYFYMTDDGQSGLRLSFDKLNLAFSAINASPAPTQETEPEASPETAADETAAVSSAPEDDTDGYHIYDDKKFGFSCAYPDSMEKYNDNTATGRLTLKSEDGSGILRICASENSTSVTTEQSLSVFKSKCGGTAESEKSDENHYEITIKNGEKLFYKYLKLANGNMYWFELEYKEKDRAIYDEYIKYIYNSFTIK